MEANMPDEMYATGIHSAVAECGGEDVLAKHLQVPVDKVRSWVQGSTVPPPGKFFVALVLAKIAARHTH
jgi:hypothetical protein